MWVIAEYSPTTLFSLRPANATTSGGKTLITPTPFALKMALIDAAIRVHGKAAGERWFPKIRDLRISIALSEHITVINTFVKILRPHKNGPKDVSGTGLSGPMGSTIAYRELVQFGGTLQIAFQDISIKGDILPLANLLLQVNYLGKRGGFMQLMNLQQSEQLSSNFITLNDGSNGAFPLNGVLQMLDDCGPKMTFEHADIYSSKSISINKSNGRIFHATVLPYQVMSSSRGYTLYHRVA